jgi:hypothetical protein
MHQGSRVAIKKSTVTLRDTTVDTPVLQVGWLGRWRRSGEHGDDGGVAALLEPLPAQARSSRGSSSPVKTGTGISG